MTEAAIAVLPYGKALGPDLARLPLTELNWPLGCPDRLLGKTVGDLGSEDHLIVYPKTSTHYRLRRGTKARISLIMGEPSVIHSKHFSLLKWTHRRFYRVLTFNQQALDNLPNALLMPYGTTWVPEWRDLTVEKTKTCSLIASAKRDSTGHKLRHAVVDWVRETDQDVEIMGRGYTPFEQKSEGVLPYRYSVVIENVQEKNYFSEKLLDAVFCETVPIYWGCPNLSDFVDPAGIMICNTEDEILSAVETMSVEDYEARLPALRALKSQLEVFADLELRAAQASGTASDPAASPKRLIHRNQRQGAATSPKGRVVLRNWFEYELISSYSNQLEHRCGSFICCRSRMELCFAQPTRA